MVSNRFTESIENMGKNMQEGKQGILSDVIPQNPAGHPAAAEAKKAGNPVTLDIQEVVGSLNAGGRKGQSITLYLKTEVLEQLNAIAKEKNIKPGKIASAILEKALLP
jgi:hypothetical protein